ncbi:unnamed protein product [Rotaria magnacalcarata]|uniref:Uncharacterized protein n=1 Tax=Rotaria magnacalcarata TaxID=392030 RepID=A0A815PV91_9BILA|nr:unnamed protein product [Rotaria magnacalcarata]CAF1628855.1 unnamed protein product [Rotaria magnacalcarata]CAF2036502.1 unnamed protein product [Rotaria magnacalcarata]CAF4094639.1 unnamed protein product [Rotaria magnacalcarata]CAF4837754.1 unnamed protein product [Rotaria magnacalcarata]
MLNGELQFFRNSIGEFLLVDGYFSVYLYRQHAIFHLNNIDIANNFEKNLFEISIDPNVDVNKSYCNSTSLSYLTNEEKIIFTLGSIFRLVDISQQDDGQMKIWIIKMKLSTHKHKRLKSLLENVKKQYHLQQFDRLYH